MAHKASSEQVPSQSPSCEKSQYRYLDTLVLIFVIVLLVSNLVAQKVCRLGPFTISGAELLFPITYIFGDVFTEVYGFQASRRAIWIGFFASLLLIAAGAMAVALPAAPSWRNQHAFEIVFGIVPRFVAASLIAYWVGEFANAFTLARLKVLTKGKWLWTRTISSTIVGQAFDTFLVMTIAFAGQIPRSTLIRLILGPISSRSFTRRWQHRSPIAESHGLKVMKVWTCLTLKQILTPSLRSEASIDSAHTFLSVYWQSQNLFT